jgi:hypothetical protein
MSRLPCFESAVGLGNEGGGLRSDILQVHANTRSSQASPEAKMAWRLAGDVCPSHLY